MQWHSESPPRWPPNGPQWPSESPPRWPPKGPQWPSESPPRWPPKGHAQWPLESQLIILVLILRYEEFVLFQEGSHSPTEQRLSFKNISDSTEAEATHFLSCWLLNPSFWLHVTQFFPFLSCCGKKVLNF